MSASWEESLSLGSILRRPLTNPIAFRGNFPKYLERECFVPPLVPALDGFWFAELREFHADESGVLLEQFLLIRSERSKQFLDEVQLIDLVLSRKEWVAICQLAQQAPDRPRFFY